MRLQGNVAHSVLVVVIVLGLQSPALAQLRIATWNTEDGPTSTANSAFRTVFEAIGDESVNGIAKPVDLLILQEQGITTANVIASMLNDIYATTAYAASVDPVTDTDGDIFDDKLGYVWNTSTVENLGLTAITTGGPRPAYRGLWRPVGYDNPEAEFYTYSSHFKAGSTPSDVSTRALEAGRLRLNGDLLGPSTNIIYAGDYNVQSATESAFQILTTQPGDGIGVDPKGGNFSIFNHTQNPGGPLDDRFDFQLISEDIDDDEGFALIDNAAGYRAFGNNGTHPFGGSIGQGTGATPAVLTALEQAADHLPVVVDYQVPSVVGASSPVFSTVVDQNTFELADFTVFNDADVVGVLGADELNYEITFSGDVLGVFGLAFGTDDALGGANPHQVVLDTLTPGPKSGEIIITATSEGANTTPVTLDLDWTVVADFLTGDADGDGDVDGDDLIAVQANFGSTSPPPGDADGDGDVDGDDLIAVQANFGATSPAVAVPEPAACLLLAIGMLGAGVRRKAS